MLSLEWTSRGPFIRGWPWVSATLSRTKSALAGDKGTRRQPVMKHGSSGWQKAEKRSGQSW